MKAERNVLQEAFKDSVRICNVGLRRRSHNTRYLIDRYRMDPVFGSDCLTEHAF